MSAGLLKLDKPYMVGKTGELIVHDEDEGKDEDEDIEMLIAALNEEDENESGGESGSGMVEQGQIIDVLLPPFHSVDGEENTWITRVSRAAPSRSAVIQLWEKLDLKLVERQARPAGICSVRSTLFDECFDELIRQVTLDCAERGLLLARVRDEAQMTLTAFQSLFESASEFGASKAVQAESGACEVEAELRALDDRVSELKAKVRRREAWRRQVARRAYERRGVQAALSGKELEGLHRSEKQYQLLIETVGQQECSTNLITEVRRLETGLQFFF